ncbi:transcriptional regulator [bacterium]|nr:MAG: transcriptional regulator [bacterium]
MSLSNTKIADMTPEECLAVRETFDRVGDRWSLYILGQLRHGPCRFNQLRRDIEGISQRMLTLTLRHLERDGLVKRTVYPTNPPQVEYALTDLGLTLLPPIVALIDWAEEQYANIHKSRQAYDANRQ